MKNSKFNRRNFLKLSAGAAAAAMYSPAFSRVLARQSASLRVGIWDNLDAEPMENEILEGFKKLFPDIDVVFEFNPDGYDDKILTGLAGGNAPDIFLWWDFPKLVARDGLEDLTPYIDGDSPLDASIYYPQILNYNRVGDGLYGLPKDFTPRAIFYNKTLFDEAGLDYPTNDWTWDDMFEMAKAMTQGEGVDKQYGLYTYSGTYPLQYYVWSNGGDFIAPDGMSASGYLDSAETIEALDWYIKLQTEHGLAPTSTEEETTGGPGDLFMNGKLAIFDNGRWPQSQFKEVPDLNFGTVLPPLSPTGERVTVLHEAGWCMNPDTSSKPEAWELLKWLAGAEAHRIRTEAGWAIPAVPSVAEELGLLEDEIEKTWFEAVPFATIAPCFTRAPNWSRADEEIGLAIETAFLGEASIEEALMDATPVVDRLLKG